MPNNDPRYWIEHLRLEPHPEGGYFRQTYRSDLTIPRDALPGFSGSRPACTAIYFLLQDKNFSAFHRLRSDEMWHFYLGSPLQIHIIDREWKYSSFLLGNELDAGHALQAVVPSGCWFASHVAEWKGWALVGCTVSPGFDFADFELAKRGELSEEYPQHGDLIRRLTRES